jgi:transcriptional regulator with XRE-family HTH domain
MTKTKIEYSDDERKIYLGKNITFLKHLYGMKQKDLCQKFGRSFEQVYRLERVNERTQIPLGLLVRIANTFKISLENLVKVDLNSIAFNEIDQYLKISKYLPRSISVQKDKSD